MSSMYDSVIAAHRQDNRVQSVHHYMNDGSHRHTDATQLLDPISELDSDCTPGATELGTTRTSTIKLSYNTACNTVSVIVQCCHLISPTQHT
jgi:hypothetical protein